MRLETKRWIIGLLGVLFLLSLVLVQAMEVLRKRQEAGLVAHYVIPASSKQCVDCHQKATPAIIDHWKGSTHAAKAVGCVECHQADKDDADAFDHWGAMIATVVTPRDCSRCHPDVYKEFTASHHARAGQILGSLDNLLAEVVEGSRVPFNPHSPTPGMAVEQVNGMASAFTGCQQCHGSKVALQATEGEPITVDDLQPGPDGKPTNTDAIGRIKKEKGRPLFNASTWPNTGIGRLNLDGSLGSCSACHSRHDFSPRRARQPENCGKCHLGPDHPQKEIYEESKHGVAYRDLKLKMNLDAESWILGKDYSQAPTCATCHMSGHTRNEGKVTHDPGMRISWTNRPEVSRLLDNWEEKRQRMKDVCSHCHTPSYIDAFYKQYDDFVVLYNEKFGKPGQQIMKALLDEGLRTEGQRTGDQFDEEIEWTWFYLWHHEGRRARHGAAMMAPDYAHWHGMYEVSERFYQKLIPQTLEICQHAEAHGKAKAAWKVRKKLDDILERPEHRWFPRPKLPPEPKGTGS
jgi:hydroxylamine dehydrogenase